MEAIAYSIMGLRGFRGQVVKFAWPLIASEASPQGEERECGTASYLRPAPQRGERDRQRQTETDRQRMEQPLLTSRLFLNTDRVWNSLLPQAIFSDSPTCSCPRR